MHAISGQTFYQPFVKYWCTYTKCAA